MRNACRLPLGRGGPDIDFPEHAMTVHRSNLPAHENGLHEEATIHAYFADIWLRMGQCMERGMKAEGVLPVRSAFPDGRRRCGGALPPRRRSAATR